MLHFIGPLILREPHDEESVFLREPQKKVRIRALILTFSQREKEFSFSSSFESLRMRAASG